MEMISRFSEKKDRELESEVMVAHQKHLGGNTKMKNYMRYYWEPPTEFESFIYASQVLQAHAMKTGIEIHRRYKPYCWGTLYWQLNDCWPSVSWSSVDYAGNWKATQHEAKKSYQPVYPILWYRGDTFNVTLSNDLLRTIPCSLELKAYRLDNGKVVWQNTTTHTLLPNSNLAAYSSPLSRLPFKNDTTRVFIEAKLIEIKGNKYSNLSSNLLFFKDFKNLELGKDPIVFDVTPSKNLGSWNLKITSPCFHKWVYLYTKDYLGKFSDNYFDLFSGKPVELTLTTPTDWSIKKVKSMLQWMSLARMDLNKD
jgi:beta-mannosidase